MEQISRLFHYKKPGERQRSASPCWEEQETEVHFQPGVKMMPLASQRFQIPQFYNPDHSLVYKPQTFSPIPIPAQALVPTERTPAALTWAEPQDFKNSPAFNYFENEEEANEWEESSNLFGCVPDSFIQGLEPQQPAQLAKEKQKKQFTTKEEMGKYIEGFKVKYKTEICKNWQMTGDCEFRNSCSFAHGPHELK